MKQKLVCSLLVLTLLMGMVGTSFAASAPPSSILPFGEEVAPLTKEEMEEVDGAWGAHIAVAVMGAAMGGLGYLATTAPADRNWTDGLERMME